VPILGYLCDVLTGRIAHWTTTNNVVVTEVWNKIGSLPEPQCSIFRSFHVSAGCVVEALVGPGTQSRSVGLHFNLKEISIDQFRDLYDILLTYFVVLFSRTHSERGTALMEDLNKVVSNQGSSQQLIDSLSEIEEVDMAALGGKTWDQVVSILGFGDGLAAGQLAYFSIIVGNAYVEAARDV